MIGTVVNERVAGRRRLSVSASSPAWGADGGASLCVSVWHGRGYDERGRLERVNCDAAGRRFSSSEEAFRFALERGYLRRYFTSADLRLRRVLRGAGFGRSYEVAVFDLEPRDVEERLARWKRSHRVSDLFPGTVEGFDPRRPVELEEVAA